jgi:hypothetical protein
MFGPHSKGGPDRKFYTRFVLMCKKKKWHDWFANETWSRRRKLLVFGIV